MINMFIVFNSCKILSQLKKICCIVPVSCFQKVQQSSAAILIILSNKLEEFYVKSILEPLNNSILSESILKHVLNNLYIHQFYPCGSNLLFNLIIAGRTTSLLFKVIFMTFTHFSFYKTFLHIVVLKSIFLYYIYELLATIDLLYTQLIRF